MADSSFFSTNNSNSPTKTNSSFFSDQPDFVTLTQGQNLIDLATQANNSAQAALANATTAATTAQGYASNAANSATTASTAASNASTYASNAANSATTASSLVASVPHQTVSSSLPSGGTDGDIWYVV